LKASQKQARALARRVEAWEAMPAVSMVGTTTKIVRLDSTTAAYHKPGSQNRKKGAGRNWSR
jgi:hypothetical protein